MFACIFIPDFCVQAILRLEPGLRTRAVAVLSGRAPLEKVMGVNERARQAGVEVGTTKVQLEAWEDLVLRARSELQEASAHAALLDCALLFSPEVEDGSPGTVLLDLAGLESLLGPLAKIAGDLGQRVSRMGLEGNVAVAKNPDAALLGARGFRGVTVIPEGGEAERLGDLRVEVLLESFSPDAERGARWMETFDRWGIHKLRELAALPEVPVSERLGQEGIRLQKLARGASLRKLRGWEPRLIFAESVELEDPIVLLEPLAFLLNRMLELVCARLRERALAVQELRLNLELAGTRSKDCASVARVPRMFARSLRLPTPMLDTKVFLKLLQLDLQAHPPGAPIVKIHLSAEPARPRAWQSGLFQPVFPEAEKLELTLARIAGIVGEDRVGSAELLDTHREGAFTMRHFAPAETAPQKSKARQSAKQKKREIMWEKDNVWPNGGWSGEMVEEDGQESGASEKMSAVMGLRLFRPALAANVTLREGKPVRLRCFLREDIAGEIVWVAGPWRSAGDWSEQDGWSREEWDIAVPCESGLALYRLVQDKLNGKWFVEGMYD